MRLRVVEHVQYRTGGRSSGRMVLREARPMRAETGRGPLLDMRNDSVRYGLLVGCFSTPPAAQRRAIAFNRRFSIAVQAVEQYKSSNPPLLIAGIRFNKMLDSRFRK